MKHFRQNIQNGKGVFHLKDGILQVQMTSILIYCKVNLLYLPFLTLFLLFCSCIFIHIKIHQYFDLGIRLSTEFINGLMWFATVSNITEYHGSVKVLDSQINGTISYKPPVIRVQQDELLTVSIPYGLILATCKPRDEAEQPTKILFKAEFSNLAGSGRIGLASTDDKTGIKVNIDSLDMSHMTTKPFEPKLPLPEQFEGELLRNAIGRYQRTAIYQRN